MKSLYTKKRSRKPLLIAAIIVTCLVILGVIYWKSLSPETTSPDTVETQPSDEEAVINQPSPQDKQTTAEQLQQTDDVDPMLSPDEVPASTGVIASITHAAQEDMTVRFTASIDGATSGTCSATFTSDYGRPVAKTSPLENGVCSQQINALEFDALGEWLLTLHFYSNNTKATDTARIIVR